MNRCSGCGGLTERENLCDRCFNIKNYNKYQQVDIKSQEFIDILKKINENDLVVLVIDLLNIPKNLDLFKSILKGKIILALTKFDLMPTNNEKKFIDYFSRYNFNFIDAVCISSKNNYNLDSIYESILKNSNGNNVYFVGYTNAGKSSLINKLIYNYSNSKSEITVSCLPNTTLDTISVKLDNIYLVDTPGILSEEFLDDSSSDIIKKLSKNKKIKPISYQIKEKQYIIIENILKLEIVDNDIIIYIPSNFNVDRYYKDKDILDSNYKSFDITETSDIVIPGIGFIKVMKSGNVKITALKNLNMFTRKPLI